MRVPHFRRIGPERCEPDLCFPPYGPGIHEGSLFRKVLQSICWQVSSGQEVVVVGNIQPDQTVKGGTGWGAEFAKICNKPLLVFDQEQDGWYRWLNDAWVKVEEPVIEHTHFTATGTRFMEANGRKAISDLFARSFNR